MNRYAEMMRRHLQEINELPISFAFNANQFNKMMEDWGLDAKKDLDKIYHTTFGGFYQKKDAALIRSTINRHKTEMNTAIAEDKTGTGFIYEMWLVELEHHEYINTMDSEDTMTALGYTVDEVMDNPALKCGLEKAISEIIKRDF